jgi:hypothetical protein
MGVDGDSDKNSIIGRKKYQPIVALNTAHKRQQMERNGEKCCQMICGVLLHNYSRPIILCAAFRHPGMQQILFNLPNERANISIYRALGSVIPNIGTNAQFLFARICIDRHHRLFEFDKVHLAQSMQRNQHNHQSTASCSSLNTSISATQYEP